MCQQKPDILHRRGFNPRNGIMKEHCQIQQTIFNCGKSNIKNLGKCLYYAKGYCRRGARCWYKHSNSEIQVKNNGKYDKESYQNDDQLQHENWQNFNEGKTINFNNSCNSIYDEGKNTINKENKYNILSKEIINIVKHNLIH
jgi:hypothetical protein